MNADAKRNEKMFEIKEYKLQYPLSAYTFPSEARIHQVRFDDKFLCVELMDGRMLSVPLWWIPTLHNAAPEEIAKFEISRDRTMIIWDPDKCAINDEIRIADYLMPNGAMNHSLEERSKTVAYPRPKMQRGRQRIAKGKAIAGARQAR